MYNLFTRKESCQQTSIVEGKKKTDGSKETGESKETPAKQKENDSDCDESPDLLASDLDDVAGSDEKHQMCSSNESKSNNHHYSHLLDGNCSGESKETQGKEEEDDSDCDESLDLLDLLEPVPDDAAGSDEKHQMCSSNESKSNNHDYSSFDDDCSMGEYNTDDEMNAGLTAQQANSIVKLEFQNVELQVEQTKVKRLKKSRKKKKKEISGLSLTQKEEYNRLNEIDKKLLASILYKIKENSRKIADLKRPLPETLAEAQQQSGVNDLKWFQNVTRNLLSDGQNTYTSWIGVGGRRVLLGTWKTYLNAVQAFDYVKRYITDHNRWFYQTINVQKKYLKLMEGRIHRSDEDSSLPIFIKDSGMEI
jgi:hypothetical protein